ncbi:MAG: DNA-directed RNA polymerase subunit beta [Nitrospirae bacterium]|nr:DNA-directed RNA polymerase subunit beta [Nitrospirota bacterium]
MTKFLMERLNFSDIKHVLDTPYLIEFQKKSFDWFLQRDVKPDKKADQGLQAAFNGIFPIVDYKGMVSLDFLSYSLGEPQISPHESLVKGLNYTIPLRIKARLNIWEKDEKGQKKLKESREQEIYIGEIPLMTETGSFIINGTERVIVNQMHRSPGVYFAHDKGRTHASGRLLYTARVIPVRGSWLDFEFDSKDILNVRIDRRKKLPATVVLKALGYSNEDLLKAFYPIEEIILKDKDKYTRVVSDVLVGLRTKHNIVSPDKNEVIVREGGKINKASLKRIEAALIKEIPISRDEIIGRVTLNDIVDPSTGEIILDSNKEITEDIFDRIISLKIDRLRLLFIDNVNYLPSLRETLLTDKVGTREDAFKEIHKKLRPGEPAVVDAAKELFNGLFFDPKRYDLSPVGRLKINKKLGMDIDLNTRVLTDNDIIEMVRYLLNLRTGKGEIDDIDHLGNRRVRGVGELLENQFRMGLVRMERTVREKMTVTEMEEAMPHDLINAKPVIAAIKEFFGSSQLSQFMDQTNLLAEVTHKRRLSALGPGGLTRERAGFEVRDVHPTHYGRICPIETPEGPNIGLITSLASYAKVNDFGFIEAPYRKVKDGRLTDEIEYLSAIEGERSVIAEATSPFDSKGYLIGEAISARVSGDFKIVPPHEVQYMDVSPNQIVSVSTALIPFLENDDANRALMGSNMQRQAVPLLTSEAPIVGTGMERAIARDSGWLKIAERSGIVESVDSSRIVVRSTQKDGGVDIYNLTKFFRSNQGTCMNQKPIVDTGDIVNKGDILADGPSTDMGELALGKNVIVAFMPWGGYNFEDAIVLNERLVKDDVFTSIHIEELEVESRDTKLGPEEITRDIPNVGEDMLSDLDESGIIRVGAEVKPGDILVGKVTPKGETILTSEEKLMRAIFGDKAEEVKESSLYVPPGIEGTVIDVRVLCRKGSERDARAKSIEQYDIDGLLADLEDEIRALKEQMASKIRSLLTGQKAPNDLLNPKTKEVIASKGKSLTKQHLDKVQDSHLIRINIENTDVKNKIDEISRETNKHIKNLETRYHEKIEGVKKGDELPPGINKIVKLYIAMKRKINVGDKMAGRHGNKGVVSVIMPEEDMPYLSDGTPVDVVLNPLGVPSRMNVGQILETHLGWAAKSLGYRIAALIESIKGDERNRKKSDIQAVRKNILDIYDSASGSFNDMQKRIKEMSDKDLLNLGRQDIKVATPVFEGAKEKEIKEFLKKAGCDVSGQVTLYDGRTGEPFKRPITVGCMYMMKLHHLVADKIHARSTGPYSLVTQQPLGGKAQFGGQRLGEMEVWALEAYGAANILQEFLTVKSDDINGRSHMYEAIVKGSAVLDSGMPESFHVLIKELQSLCLDVELLKHKKSSEKNS